MAMPLYQFAQRPDGGFVDVFDLTPQDRGASYRCVGCGQDLIPHLKDDCRTKHFAHRSREACSPEMYYHIMAKNLFALTFKECRRNNSPYMVERDYNEVCRYTGEDHFCFFGGRSRRHDLTCSYDQLALEKEHKGFVVDCLLTDSTGRKKPLLVEMFVSHDISEKKVKSGEQILQLRVDRKQADDSLRAIKDGFIPCYMAEWINFPEPLIRVSSPECLFPPIWAYPRRSGKSRGSAPSSGGWAYVPEAASGQYKFLMAYDANRTQIFWDRRKSKYACTHEHTTIMHLDDLEKAKAYCQKYRK